MTENKIVIQKELTPSERFSNRVIQEFAGSSGTTASLTQFQKRLIQNYFINLDMGLKTAEEKRLKKDEKYRDEIPVTWSNVNIESLAVNVVACARIGYDPALPNHINMIPFKNNTTKKYDIVFVAGYRGKELLAKKYGLEVPSDTVIELVYSTDVFNVIKKDIHNTVESYEFSVTNPFNRGEIIGGFYYHVFSDSTRNKLVFFSKHEIDKRKPAYASSEFWGGEKDKWENGKKVGKEQIEGWYAEMALKTIARSAYGSITIDSQKIDDDFIKLNDAEQQSESLRNDPDPILTASKETIQLNANKEDLSFETAEVVEPKLTPVVTKAPVKEYPMSSGPEAIPFPS